ncbi:MAG: tetratricopeptide repeat protein [Pseudomonadota bacterium]
MNRLTVPLNKAPSYGLVSILAWGLTMTPVTGIAMTDQELFLEAERLMAMRNYDDAYALLNAQLALLAGDATYDRLLARSALETARPAVALLALERAVVVAPDSIEAHLNMGRAYVELSQWQEAKNEFLSVYGLLTSSEHKHIASTYLQRIDEQMFKRSRTFSAFFELGGGGDNNANAAPRIDKFFNFTLNDNSRQSASQQLFGRLQGASRVEFSPHLHMSNQIYFAQNWYPQTSFVNNTMLGINNVLVNDFGNWANIYSVQGFQTQLVGITNNWGSNLSVMHRRMINPSLFWDVNARYGRVRYVAGYAIKDNNQTQLGVHGQYLLPLTAPITIDLALQGGQEIPTQSDSPYQRDYVNTHLILSTRDRGSEYFVQTGFTYNDFPSRFFGLSRVDRTTDFSLGMNLHLKNSWYLRPSLSTQRNLSSVDLYEYRRTIAGIAIRRDLL